MRMSRLFGRTLREPPADAEMTSHRLLVRGGFMRPLTAGLYAYLPLGQRVVRRIEAIIRQEMEAIGAQEMQMPVLAPASLQQATGEERVAELARREVRSYRDLPQVVYHIQTKVWDEPRPGSGRLRMREFRTKDAYSLHTDMEDLARFYPSMLEAYRRIFTRCGLSFLQVEADVGMMESADSYEFLMPHPAGEDRLVRCLACGYAANVERAEFRLPEPPPQPPEEAHPIATPNCATIADVADFVGVPTSQTLKAVFYAWERPGRALEPVFVVIRGDLEVNETKLANLLGGGRLRPATGEEIRSIGAEPGYASPVGLRTRTTREGEGVLVVGDRSIRAGINFVAGANQEGYHLVGVNYPRDFAVTLLADVAQAQAGYACPRCGEPLAAEPAIELGRCSRLGTRYSETLGVIYLDAAGQERPVAMGSYSIGIGRLMAAVVETHHDEYGIIWPPALAPFDVHLLTLGTDEPIQAQAEEVYAGLEEAGLEVLWDERNESAGVKFADADLIGCPARVTLSNRSLAAGGAEVKARWEKERQIASVKDLAETIRDLLDKWPGL